MIDCSMLYYYMSDYFHLSYISLFHHYLSYYNLLPYFHYNMHSLYMLALLVLSYRYSLLLYYMFIYFMLYPVHRTSLFNSLMLHMSSVSLPNYSIMSNYIYPYSSLLLSPLMLHFHSLVSLDSDLYYMLD